MGKAHKGKTCVYCSRPGVSDTGDHVIARKLFPENMRDDLPIVPSCASCNSAKSELELYAMSVVPFGARHPEALNILSTMVPPRLEKNQRLARHLGEGAEIHHVSSDGGVTWEMEFRLPFDSGKVQRLFELIARGLANHHWQVLLPGTGFYLRSIFFSADGHALFERLFQIPSTKTDRVDLGNGIFVYEGLQSLTTPEFTIWRMALGGMVLGGDPNSPTEESTAALVVTGPNRDNPAIGIFDALCDRDLAGRTRR